MDKLRIVGGTPLRGEISISGAKNAALHAAAILALNDKAVAKKLTAWRARQTRAVAKTPK